MKKGRAITRILLHVIAFSIGVLWLLPFLGVFMASIRPFGEILNGWWSLNPFNASLNSFVEAFFDPYLPLSRGILNSLIVTIPSTIIPLLVGALAGYVFARFSFRIRTYLFVTIVLLMALPQQSVVVPLFQTMVNFRLVNSYLSLVLIHSAWGLPWIILFMRNFFTTLPIEVEEAARVDGASDFKIFYKIVLPMALPALASVVVLQFMWVWNDFFLAKVFIWDESMLLATQRIEFIGREAFRVNWGVLSAASIIVMIVPILVFVLLQQYYVKGMIGYAVKG
ncbi:MAG: carbohydrate ABC transporter permease [Candidatus Bathyarchaeota archaeon]|nr:carbohydrate ABC transporter permease [Candidatus Bathyarchaeota archaeon]